VDRHRHRGEGRDVPCRRGAQGELHALILRHGTAGPAQFSFTLDPRKKPAQMDLREMGDGQREGIVHAIYALEKGELRICFGSNLTANKAEERPQEFATSKGSKDRPPKGRVMFTFKRPEKASRPERTGQDQGARPRAGGHRKGPAPTASAIATSTCAWTIIRNPSPNWPASWPACQAPAVALHGMAHLGRRLDVTRVAAAKGRTGLKAEKPAASGV
jgi:uncharacterized protein (TIGR03067 family)